MPHELPDLRTVILLTTIVALTTAAAMVLLWRSRTEERALPMWAFGAVLVGAGFLGIALRGLLPPLLSIPLANASVVVGHALFLRGIDRLFERKPLSWPVIGALGAGTLIWLSYFYYIEGSTAARMLFVLTVIGLLSIAAASRLYQAVAPSARLPQHAVAAVFLTFGSVLLARVALMLSTVPEQDLFAPSSIHAVVFTAFLLLYAALMYCFPALLFAKDAAAGRQAQDVVRRANAELEQRVRERTAELEDAKSRAEQANLSKSRFLARVSHELRTPLNAILGYAQVLELGGQLGGSSLANVQEIQHAGNHLLAVVNDLLDLSRVESGKLDFSIETISLGEVIAESCAQNEEAAIRRGIVIVQDAACGECQVQVDRQRLRQVLNNLISNAIKYNRPHGRVTLSCNVVVPGRVRLGVHDTGIGIEPEKQTQLFQSFNWLGAELDPVEGNGIGLVISRLMLEAMDCSIGFASTPGVGSEFWLEMPGQINAQLGLLASGRFGTDAAGRRKRILVAEDYAPNQTVLKLQLASLGCETEMVADGAAALEKWRTQEVDLILTDVNMPRMDGLQLAQAIRREEGDGGRRIPIVGITAAVASGELARCLDAGMNAVLSKPIELEDLREAIARWTGEPQAEPAHGAVTDSAVADAAVFDLEHLYRVLGRVSISHARQLIALFQRSAAEGLSLLAGNSGDGAAVAREMHKQKSAARTVGAMRYAARAIEFESRANAGGSVDLQHLHVELAAFRQAVASLELTPDAAEDRAQPAQREASSYGTVLVIDDDAVLLQQLTVMLAGLGVGQVLTADSGQAALAILQARGDGIESLVCDLNMPGMDGVQLIRQMRETSFRGGLILMSGADEKVLNTVSELATRQGLRVLGHAQKPVVPEQMAALLARLGETEGAKRQVGVAADVSAEDIRQGIDNDEFSIWFQPKVDAASLEPIGIEALARWRRSDGRVVPPDIFIVAAERYGLIGELSQILVSKSLLEGVRLHEAGFPLKIAVNLSGRWLDDLNLPDFVLATAQMAGLKVEDILFEVTETGIMEDLTIALDVLSRLRLKGFGLSIDDFGIGYSSFEQLGRIPFTELKLDRSFVIKGNQDVAARAILESSMDMARKLGLATVAEGVETGADLELVRVLGCDSVQGYLLAKPMPVTDLLSWLRTHQPETA